MSVSEVPRKRWTFTEYRHLTEIGVLEDGKVELVRGEIWCKIDKDRRHIAASTFLLTALAPVLGFDHLQIRSSTPLSDESDPEPDLAMLAQTLEHYLDCNPEPSDVVFVAEVSNLTLHVDMTIKQLLYAESGIPEYWVIDLPNRLLHVFREPTEGGYASETVLTPEDEVSPLAAPDAAVRVSDLLP